MHVLYGKINLHNSINIYLLKDHLKHKIFDDPVELAPFVALALWLLGKLYEILDSLEINNERYNLGQIGSVSSQTFGTVFPKRPISILPAASPPMVMSNQTLWVT